MKTQLKQKVNEENIIQYLSNRMNEREKAEFYKALERDIELKREFIKQKNLWAVSTSFGEEIKTDTGQSEFFLYRLQSKKKEVSTLTRLNVRLTGFKVAAAVLFAMLLVSVYMLTQKQLANQQTEVLYTETYVPRGEMSELTLPDGTHLLINADTRVQIPSNFSADNRHLKLVGEAYFEVRHNPNSPLIVETESINIEVLGTSFDLSCYREDEFVTTMLDEGKIRFAGANNNKVNGTFLKPGETAYYHKSSGIFKIKLTNQNSNISLWKEGRLKFKDMPFHTLARKIERLYNVEIEVDECLKYERYTGEINEETVWEVMQSFAIATPFDVESSGRKIIVKPKKNFK